MTDTPSLPDPVVVDTSGGAVSVTVVGEGAPLVLLHGGGPGASALANYRENLPALAGFRVVLPDQPGFGASWRPSQEQLDAASITELTVTALFEALDALGIERCSLLGNSLGGAAALAMAIARPERVAGLVLMAPGGGWVPTAPTPTEGQKAMFRYYNGGGPSVAKMRDFVRTMVADARSFDDAAITARYQASLEPSHIDFYHRLNASFAARGGMDPLWKDLDRVAAPTLLLWGRDDRTITLDGAALMLKQLRDVQLHVFSRCGHWVQVERKAEFERLVVDFLTHLPDRR